MLRIQPQSIIFDSADRYRVLFEGKTEDYTFSVKWTEGIGVLNCEQREFYFDTHDDPATKLLLKAIDEFDEARRKGTVKLVTAVKHQTEEPGNKYKVCFQTNSGEKECRVTVDDVGMGEELTVPLLTGDSNFLDITKGDPAADCLRESIFALHAARQFKYAEEVKSTSDIRTSKSKRASA